MVKSPNHEEICPAVEDSVLLTNASSVRNPGLVWEAREVEDSWLAEEI